MPIKLFLSNLLLRLCRKSQGKDLLSLKADSQEQEPRQQLSKESYKDFHARPGRRDKKITLEGVKYLMSVKEWDDLEDYLKDKLTLVQIELESCSAEPAAFNLFELRGKAQVLRQLINLKAHLQRVTTKETIDG